MAGTSEEAAKIARDMLLDPDTQLAAEVGALYWREEAESSSRMKKGPARREIRTGLNQPSAKKWGALGAARYPSTPMHG
jgi:hypothetical protein